MPRFESQDPSSWGWPRGAAADVVPFSYRGHGFPQGVARATARLFTIALDRICAQPGFVLPERLDLGAGMWGFSDRRKRQGGDWSFHAYGLAIDVAAPWNPQGSRIPPPSVHRLPGNTDELVRPLGILWGAAFSDWMHLECHLSPLEVAELVRALDSPRQDVAPEPCPLLPGEYFGPRSGPARSISNMWQPRPPYVRALQRVQRALGVPADGLYGPQTAAAARSWQAANGLVPDGLIGRATWRSLFGE